jgi:hypothetical protein
MPATRARIAGIAITPAISAIIAAAARRRYRSPERPRHRPSPAERLRFERNLAHR